MLAEARLPAPQRHPNINLRMTVGARVLVGADGDAIARARAGDAVDLGVLRARRGSGSRRQRDLDRSCPSAVGLTGGHRLGVEASVGVVVVTAGYAVAEAR